MWCCLCRCCWVYTNISKGRYSTPQREGRCWGPVGLLAAVQGTLAAGFTLCLVAVALAALPGCCWGEWDPPHVVATQAPVRLPCCRHDTRERGAQQCVPVRHDHRQTNVYCQPCAQWLLQRCMHDRSACCCRTLFIMQVLKAFQPWSAHRSSLQVVQPPATHSATPCHPQHSPYRGLASLCRPQSTGVRHDGPISPMHEMRLQGHPNAVCLLRTCGEFVHLLRAGQVLQATQVGQTLCTAQQHSAAQHSTPIASHNITPHQLL
jgi:hypothetical protein